jgi:hypothetical protein
MKGAPALLLTFALTSVMLQTLAVVAARPAAPRAPAVDWSATPVADTWVARGYTGGSGEPPTGPHGSEAELHTGFYDGGAVRELALLRFDTSALPTNAAVASARLSLYVDHAWTTCQQPGKPLTLTLQVVLDPWAEATLRGRDLPAFARGGRDLLVPEVRAAADRQWVDFDVTDVVAFWQDAQRRLGLEPAGLMLSSRPTCSSLGWEVVLASRESDHPPRLEVTYTTGGGTLTPLPRGTLVDVTVAGRLVDASAANITPVPGARAYAHAWGGRCGWSTLTGPDGRFLHNCRGVDRSSLVDLYLDAPAPFLDQEHRYPLSAPGLEDGVIDMRAALEPTPGPTNVPDHFTLWVLDGTVRGAQPSGEVPVAGAKVELTSHANCRTPVYTDGAGTFEILCREVNGLSNVVVAISADGYQPWRREFMLGTLGRGFDVVLTPLTTPGATEPATASPTALRTETPPPLDTPSAELLHTVWLPWSESPRR